MTSIMLENESMSLRIAPRVGGKIVELISKKSARSWLWENPELPQRQPRPGDSYMKDFDTGCFLRLVFDDPALPYLWCAHPLFRLNPGMPLHLPAKSRFKVVDQFGVGGPAVGTSIAWPISQSSSKKFFDHSHPADCPPGWAAKLFSEPLAQGWVALDSSAAKTRLVIQFDPQVLPHLGLWINRQGWSGNGGNPYNNLGVEPGTSAWYWQLEISFRSNVRPSNPCVQTLK